MRSKMEQEIHVSICRPINCIGMLGVLKINPKPV